MSMAISKDGDRYRATGIISIVRNGKAWKDKELQAWGDSETAAMLEYHRKSLALMMQWTKKTAKPVKHKPKALRAWANGSK